MLLLKLNCNHQSTSSKTRNAVHQQSVTCISSYILLALDIQAVGTGYQGGPLTGLGLFCNIGMNDNFYRRQLFAQKRHLVSFNATVY